MGQHETTSLPRLGEGQAFVEGVLAFLLALGVQLQHAVTLTFLEQAPNAIDRQLCMMQAFQHPHGSQRAFLTGLAHRYTLVPYQRRAQHAGQLWARSGRRARTHADWMLNLHILTSDGLR